MKKKPAPPKSKPKKKASAKARAASKVATKKKKAIARAPKAKKAPKAEPKAKKVSPPKAKVAKRTIVKPPPPPSAPSTAIIDAIMMEFDQEAANTRRALERVPEDKLTWKPHEKSMTLGVLASHLAEIPGWTKETLTLDEFVMDPTTYVPWIAQNNAELLERFDQRVAVAREVMKGYPDSKMPNTWRMKMGDQPIMEMPRIAVLRAMILSHTVHHRAQLGVYLRLLDVPVPAIYGPSADEQPPGR